MGINVDNYFNTSTSFKASDLPDGQQVRMVIKGCEEVTFTPDNGPEEKKLKLSFVDQDKALVLNKTNAMSISSLYGGDTDDWANKEIFLFKTKVDFGGSMVDAIRINVPMQTADMNSLGSYPEAQ